jgi:heme-degrading monooxygenase HmoA
MYFGSPIHFDGLEKKDNLYGKKLATMIVQIIKIKSGLTQEELMNVIDERSGYFRSLPGLIQKYYIKTDEPGVFGAIYVWDSTESMMEYRNSDFAKTIPEAYKVLEPPKIEVYNGLIQLRV